LAELEANEISGGRRDITDLLRDEKAVISLQHRYFSDDKISTDIILRSSIPVYLRKVGNLQF
jgi:hypothetical protein